MVSSSSCARFPADPNSTPNRRRIWSNAAPRDGKEGPWSTFRIEAGTPAQQFRVLPAHDQSTTWLVLGEACTTNDEECAEARGRLYARDNSSTWQEKGFYGLEPWLEARLGQEGDGQYGWDDITLGWAGDNLPTLKNQSVAGIVTSDFWLSSLSLNPRPVNFTDYNTPIPSLMQNLRNKTDDPIPSLSWSYTAGAYNKAPKVLGSLVLGGYDATRFQPNSVTFPFGRDQSFDFQVAIQTIRTSLADDSLLDTGIIAYISTLVPDIWLPKTVCEQFEKAFNLTWDDKTELYLMNTSLHQTLLQEDPTVTFTLGPEVSGAGVTISMPYFNFYLTASTELTNSSLPKMYFPLKRAANDSQYVLGRAFLQSAHLSADYERNSFNLSQALYPSSQNEEEIVAVLPPLKETTPGAGGPGTGNSPGGSGAKSDKSLSTGAIAGIAVGLVVVVGVIAVIAFLMYRRRKAGPKKHELADTDIMHHMSHEVSGEHIKAEMGGGMSHEVAGDMDPKAELSAHGPQKPVEAMGNSEQIYEMAGDDPNPVEMSGENIHHKIPPSLLTSNHNAMPSPISY
ncbi:acid protease [Karstenula rhodostoma CBS 690.94]|uniref:Acid protease n=1 Tax=Karstenula rhodostoma CBS 690.94 TaxID=1392251 RepID=A0A9P4PAV3_9PLEO|nr:acid protease [Karstenula rhodostoma CBS 690.94]